MKRGATKSIHRTKRKNKRNKPFQSMQIGGKIQPAKRVSTNCRSFHKHCENTVVTNNEIIIVVYTTCRERVKVADDDTHILRIRIMDALAELEWRDAFRAFSLPSTGVVGVLFSLFLSFFLSRYPYL